MKKLNLMVLSFITINMLCVVQEKRPIVFIFGEQPYFAKGHFLNKCDESISKYLLEAGEIGIKTFSSVTSFLPKSFPSEWVVPKQKPAEKSILPIITWIGHATVLIQVNDFNIITDPLFGDLSILYPRQMKPGIELKDLPHIDVILLSHNHRDHCDKKSLSALVKDQPLCLVGKGLKKSFEKMGFKNVKEKTWWEEEKISKDNKSINFTFLLAWHWSNTGLFDINKTLWGSWMIDAGSTTIYFGGDTAYEKHFSLIAKKFPKIDIALLPIGPVNPRDLMKDSHMGPEEAGQAFLDLKACVLIPIHWGTFALGTDCFLDPINGLLSWWDSLKNTQLKDKTLAALRFGQTFHYSNFA